MGNAEDIKRLIIDFIDTELVAASGPQIDPEEDLFVAGYVDSMGIMRLVAHLETTLDLKIPPSDLVPENFRSVEIMAAYLSRKAAAEVP